MRINSLSVEHRLPLDAQSDPPLYARSIGALGIATYNLDSRIRQLSFSEDVSVSSEKDISRSLEPVTDTAYSVLDDVNPFDQTHTWNDWYRLHARVAYAPKLVLARHAFAGYDMDRRREIAHQSSAIAAAIVESALKNYDNDHSEYEDHIRLTGVINEYTAIAVANHPENGAAIALPSTLYEDMKAGVDSHYYWAKGRKKLMTNLQIKSTQSRKAQQQLHYNKRGVGSTGQAVHVYADDFGNAKTVDSFFDMSHLLVDQLRGNSNADTLSTIHDASARLRHILQSHRSVRNTTDISGAT